MMTRLGAVFVFLLLCACQRGPKIPLPERDVTLPLYQVGTTHRFVKASINERDWYFLIDTGASESAVTPKAAQEMDLAVKFGGGAISGIGGEADADQSVIPKMQLGPLSIKKLPVRVVTLSSATFTEHSEILAGYLGSSFWSNYQMGLDLAGGSLTLSAPGGAPLFSGAPLSAKLTRERELYLNADIEAESLLMELDTGAEHTFLFRSKTRLRGVPGEMFVGGIGPGTTIAVETLTAASIKLGEAHVVDAPLIILHRERRKSGLLGADILSRFTIDVDPTRDTILLWPREPTDGSIDLRPPVKKKPGPAIIIEGDF
jgi:predicted aspartyl protease